MVIPLPKILTYTKCMLVNATYHTTHISYVGDNLIAW